MGNSHSGSGSSITSSQQSLASSTTGGITHHYPSDVMREAMPVPCPRSESFEREMNSSLSGMSGLCAHKEGVGSFEDDFISPGQYRARYRSNSVSIDSHLSHNLPRAKRRVHTVIRWNKGGSNVLISGSFNKWEKKIPLVKSSDNFYTIVELEKGDHQYKYYVDGQWVINPEEPTITDIHGNKNNMISVRETDFEICDALDQDSHAVLKRESSSNTTSDGCIQSDYGQEIPSRKSMDKLMGPPVLPQHLLQVILNRDVPQHLEPGLLPEPNHVMLNHMYALSIKDGVMVLSDTSRFRKKCVTTLLYKPIDS